MRKLIGIISLILCVQCAQAQSVGGDSNLFQRFASWRATNMMKGIDTSYISLPKKAWLVRANVFVSNINMTESFNQVPRLDYVTYNMNTGTSWKPHISLGYRGLELGYGIDFAHRYNRDLRLQLQGKGFGGEFHFLTFKGSTSYIQTGLESPNDYYEFDDSPIKAKRIAINAYYVFNKKTFSYPAGIKQTFFQKKSSGSVIAGAAFFHNDLSTESICEGTPTIQEMLSGDRRVKCNQIALGAGYAYNFIFRDAPLLLHASVMPMLSYTFDAHFYKDGSENTVSHIGSDKHHLGPTVVARAAVSYALSDDVLLGANVTYNYFWSDLSDHFALSTYSLTGHAYIAVRF